MTSEFDDFGAAIEGWEIRRFADLNAPNFECGYIRGEGCLEVGTGECDEQCPYRSVLFQRVDSSPVPLSDIDSIPF